MDIWIVLTSLVSFFLFICLLPILFRIVKPFAAVAWYIRLAICGGIVCIGIWNMVCFMGIVIPVDFDAFFFGAATSFMIYGLLCVLYLFGVFGTIESAITLRLLTIIAQEGKRGIHQNAVISSYNRKSIVTRRVDRLVYGGEIIMVGGYYRLSRRASYGVWREYFFHLLDRIFPRS